MALKLPYLHKILDLESFAFTLGLSIENQLFPTQSGAIYLRIAENRNELLRVPLTNYIKQLQLSVCLFFLTMEGYEYANKMLVCIYEREIELRHNMFLFILHRGKSMSGLGLLQTALPNICVHFLTPPVPHFQKILSILPHCIGPLSFRFSFQVIYLLLWQKNSCYSSISHINQ